MTRSEAVVSALDRYLDEEGAEVDGYSLAVDLIPKRGVSDVQADEVREHARKAFLGSRSR